jgi:hypothetical protein
MEIYRHYKGGLYNLIGIGTVESEEQLKYAVYQSKADDKIWLRPEEEFFGNVEDPTSKFDIQIKPRFKKLFNLRDFKILEDLIIRLSNIPITVKVYFDNNSLCAEVYQGLGLSVVLNLGKTFEEAVNFISYYFSSKNT